MSGRKGARKGPSRAEQRAAREAELDRIRRRIWTATEEQARVLRDAFEAGPGGLFVPMVGHVPRVVAALVDGECGAYREAPWTSDTPIRPGSDQMCAGVEYYFIPNARGLAHIGISPWPAQPLHPQSVQCADVGTEPAK